MKENSINSEFIIDEDGMMMEYTGVGGDVAIPDGVKDIFFEAFYGSSIINSIVIPGSVSDITPFVFEYSRIKIVRIEEGTTVIGACSFNNCDKLEIVYLPRSLYTIKMSAFANCKSLKKIYYNGTEKDWAKVIKEDDWDENTSKYCIEFSENKN